MRLQLYTVNLVGMLKVRCSAMKLTTLLTVMKHIAERRMFESGKGCADSSSSTGYVKGKRATNVSKPLSGAAAELTGQ